mmetsp:Transcript_96341/g.173818  ORF Transcript_96341/g.173818 Transcript_96341/m.173818 type:complete len:361 (-) Transcript_96341:2634-3716(-)
MLTSWPDALTKLDSKTPPEPPMGESAETDAAAGDFAWALEAGDLTGDFSLPAALVRDSSDCSPASLDSSATDASVPRSSSAFRGVGLGRPPRLEEELSVFCLPPSPAPLPLSFPPLPPMRLSRTSPPPAGRVPPFRPPPAPDGEALAEPMSKSSDTSESTSISSSAAGPPMPRPMAGRRAPPSFAPKDRSFLVCSVSEKFKLPSPTTPQLAPGLTVCSVSPVSEKSRLSSLAGISFLSPPDFERPADFEPSMDLSAFSCSSATCSKSMSRRPRTSDKGEPPADMLMPTLLRGPSRDSSSFFVSSEFFSATAKRSTAAVSCFLKLAIASSVPRDCSRSLGFGPLAAAAKASTVALVSTMSL